MITDRNTPFIDVLGKHFCAHCLNQMHENHGYDDRYYYWSVEYCNCDRAQEQLALEDKVEEMKNKLKSYTNTSYVSENRRRSSRYYIKWEAKTKVEILTEEIRRLELLSNE